MTPAPGEPPAGRDLDALVAERVMGWPPPVYITDEGRDPARPFYAWKECHLPHAEDWDCEHAWTCGRHEFYPAPPYSTDIAAAWQVVERMQRLHHCARWQCPNPECEQWTRFIVVLLRDGGIHHCTATEAAERICRAALRAAGGEGT